MTESTVAKTASVVRTAFRGYYFKPDVIEGPEKIEQREFGYMQFGQAGMAGTFPSRA
jgi:DNA primase catalytic subunit